jgi:hypothetical protein
MAATKTVSQPTRFCRSATTNLPRDVSGNAPEQITPQFGVVVLFGFGIQVKVERGHLMLEDGIGADRRQARLPRVGHGLKRLVVIGADGFVSLGALRWLADQDSTFVMLERNGTVLAVTGPIAASDARLRRAQALALYLPYAPAGLTGSYTSDQSGVRAPTDHLSKTRQRMIRNHTSQA